MKRLILLFTLLLAVSTGFFVHFRKQYNEELSKNESIVLDIERKKEDIEDIKKENESLSVEYETLKIEKEDLFTEYENWQRHNKKLEEVLN